MSATANLPRHLTQQENRALLDFSVQLHRELVDRLIKVTLYGSKARGDADEQSDLDVLVVIDKEDPETRRFILNLSSDIMLQYGVTLSVIISDQYEIQSLKRWNSLYLRNVEREGLDVWISPS